MIISAYHCDYCGNKIPEDDTWVIWFPPSMEESDRTSFHACSSCMSDMEDMRVELAEDRRLDGK